MKYYVDTNGVYKNAWSENHSGIDPAWVEVPSPPESALQVWEFPNWSAVPPVPKIVELAKEGARDKHFHNINYTIEAGDLYPKRHFTFGVLNKVEWFSDVSLTDLVIDVGISYQYDALGFATDRQVVRTYYLSDGTASPETKVTNKLYTTNPQDQLDEAIRRRTNNIRQINIWLIGAVPYLTTQDAAITDHTDIEIRDDGIDFFDTHDHEKNLYIDTGGTALEDVIIAKTGNQWEWFDTDVSPLLSITGVSDVRDYIVYQLSHGVRNAAGTI